MSQISRSADDFIGITLSAGNNPVNIRSADSDNATIIQTIAAGQMIGVIETWAQDENGIVWFEVVNDIINNPYLNSNEGWVKNIKGAFDREEMQGEFTALDKQRAAAAQANESFTQRIADFISGTTGKIITISAVLAGVYIILDYSAKTQKK